MKLNIYDKYPQEGENSIRETDRKKNNNNELLCRTVLIGKRLPDSMCTSTMSMHYMCRVHKHRQKPARSPYTHAQKEEKK